MDTSPGIDGDLIEKLVQLLIEKETLDGDLIGHGDLIPGSMIDRHVDHGRIGSYRSLGQSERGIYNQWRQIISEVNEKIESIKASATADSWLDKFGDSA